MGHLPRHNERPDDRTGRAARGQTSWGRGKLAAADVKVPAFGDRAGGQGRLRDKTVIQWRVFRDIGQDTFQETSVASAPTERILGLSPHLINRLWCSNC